MHWKRCEYLCLEPTVIREVHIEVEKPIFFPDARNLYHQILISPNLCKPKNV